MVPLQLIDKMRLRSVIAFVATFTAVALAIGTIIVCLVNKPIEKHDIIGGQTGAPGSTQREFIVGPFCYANSTFKMVLKLTGTCSKELSEFKSVGYHVDILHINGPALKAEDIRLDTPGLEVVKSYDMEVNIRFYCEANNRCDSIPVFRAPIDEVTNYIHFSIVLPSLDQEIVSCLAQPLFVYEFTNRGFFVASQRFLMAVGYTAVVFEWVYFLFLVCVCKSFSAISTEQKGIWILLLLSMLSFVATPDGRYRYPKLLTYTVIYKIPIALLVSGVLFSITVMFTVTTDYVKSKMSMRDFVSRNVRTRDPYTAGNNCIKCYYKCDNFFIRLSQRRGFQRFVFYIPRFILASLALLSLLFTDVVYMGIDILGLRNITVTMGGMFVVCVVYFSVASILMIKLFMEIVTHWVFAKNIIGQVAEPDGTNAIPYFPSTVGMAGNHNDDNNRLSSSSDGSDSSKTSGSGTLTETDSSGDSMTDSLPPTLRFNRTTNMNTSMTPQYHSYQVSPGSMDSFVSPQIDLANTNVLMMDENEMQQESPQYGQKKRRGSMRLMGKEQGQGHKQADMVPNQANATKLRTGWTPSQSFRVASNKVLVYYIYAIIHLLFMTFMIVSDAFVLPSNIKESYYGFFLGRLCLVEFVIGSALLFMPVKGR